MIIELILAIIFVEALTEIIVSSKIAEGFRIRAFNLNKWLGELVHCGYCMSVWVAATVAWSVEFGLHPVADYFLALFVIHRLSNVWHEAVVRWLNRAPITFQINKMEMQHDSEWGEPLDATTATKDSEGSAREGDSQEFLSTQETDRVIQD